MSYEGKLEVICGPMFAGKSEELIRRIKRATIAGQTVRVFKPSIDDRYGLGNITSHGSVDLEQTTGSKPIAVEVSLEELETADFDRFDVIAFDEAQFFETGILSTVIKLISSNKRVICAGLDLDYRGQPFGMMPELLALADDVTKLTAICNVCRKPATRTFRKSASNSFILIGSSDHYDARCKKCWDTTKV